MGTATLCFGGLSKNGIAKGGWNQVMRAWGCGDQKVVTKSFEMLFNAGRSKEQARDPDLPRRW